MIFSFELSQFSGSQFELHKNIWTGKIKLFKDGEEIEAYSEKDKLYILPWQETENLSIYIKEIFYEFAPHLVINGIKTSIVPELKWYNYIIGALPILLIFMGGAIGAGIGVGATYLNMSIFRSQDELLMKYLKIVAVIIASYLLFLILAGLIHQLIY